MATIIRMPEVLTGVAEAAIASWLTQVGAEVAIGAPLAEIETEKAVLEYVAEAEGTVLQLLADEGTTVTVGEPIAIIGAPGEAPVTEEAPDTTAKPHAVVNEPAAQQPVAAASASLSEPERRDEDRLFATPLVRRLARERNIDLRDLVGSGPNGRIVRRDLDRVAPTAQQMSAATAVDPRSGSGSTTDSERFVECPLTSMRKAIARRLTESKTQVPHFYLTQDVRVDALLEMRRQVNENSDQRVSVNDFVLKAVAGALRAVPEANATWSETAIREHQHVDIAVAVAISGGLVTPVLRDVDALTVTQISQAVRDMAERAKAMRLKQHELEGGSFSVSNLGMYGTQEFAAIINPPHAGILAVGAARKAPVVEEGELAVATVMKVTLSADHRVVDGAVAAQWLAAFTELIERPVRMLV